MDEVASRFERNDLNLGTRDAYYRAKQLYEEENGIVDEDGEEVWEGNDFDQWDEGTDGEWTVDLVDDEIKIAELNADGIVLNDEELGGL